MKKLTFSLFAASMVLAPLHQASAITAFVDITSPNGGEKFTAGRTVPIKWKTSIPKEAYVNLSLLKLKTNEWTTDGDYYQNVESTYPITQYESITNTGSSSWTIPYNQPAGYYVIEISVYYSEQFNNMSGLDYSAKPFRIESGDVSTTAPTITNIVPNPVYTGQKVVVTGSNFKAGSQVFMRAIGSDYYGNFEVYGAKVENKNTISFTVDQQVPAGKYDLYVQNSSGASKTASLVISESPVTPFPTIEQISPQRGGPSTVITLTGKNFTESNDINYYSSYYGPWPITEDQPTTKDEIAVGTAAESNSSDGSGGGDDEKYIMPPFPGHSGVISGVKSSNGTSLQFQLPEDVTTPGVYSISLVNDRGYSGEVFFTLLDPTSKAAHPAGSNVRGPDGTIYFIDGGNSRMPYTSAAVFNSYKFNKWEEVLPANEADMNLPLAKYVPLGSSQETTYFVPPRAGSLFKDRGTVYIIGNSQRTAFTSSKSFLGAGYSYSNVLEGDTSFMVTLVPFQSADQAHPEGTLISENGTVYVMKGGYKMGFPDLATLTSWGYSVNEVVVGNANDAKVQVSGVVSMRNPSQLNF